MFPVVYKIIGTEKLSKVVSVKFQKAQTQQKETSVPVTRGQWDASKVSFTPKAWRAVLCLSVPPQGPRPARLP